MSNQPIITIDVGDTKLAAGILLPDNTIILRRELPTMAEEGAEAVLARVIQLTNMVQADYAQQFGQPVPVAAGVASAGQIDPQTGRVVYATENLPGWTGLSLAERLTTALGLPVFVENDVNCFALAESVLGAGQGYQHLLVVAVGTGVGGGLILNGELYSGYLGRAADVGHIIVVPEGGRPCTCGRRGCLESYTATRIIVENSGFPTIQALAAHYTAGGDVPAVDEAAAWLGRGLASLVCVLGPEAILVGGSVGLLGEQYLALVRQSFVTHAQAASRSIPILPTQLGADSGLLGAGLFARRCLRASQAV
jgi:glucokinase